MNKVKFTSISSLDRDGGIGDVVVGEGIAADDRARGHERSLVPELLPRPLAIGALSVETRKPQELLPNCCRSVHLPVRWYLAAPRPTATACFIPTVASVHTDY